MRRRPPEKPPDRPVPPLWANNFPAGMEHAQRLTGSPFMTVWLPALRQAQRDWCRENDCRQLGAPCSPAERAACVGGR